MITISKKSKIILIIFLLINISISGIIIAYYKASFKTDIMLLNQKLNTASHENNSLKNKFSSLDKKYNEILVENSQLAKENKVYKHKINELYGTITTFEKRESEKNEFLGNLVNIKNIDKNIVIDMRYATKNNFTGKKIYDKATCLLSSSTAKKLLQANKEFMKKGYRIKIWDAYRPLSVQRILYDSVDDKSFVANPSRGSRHNRGTAVDLTLVDMDGNELEMPTGFDDFTIKAARGYGGNSAKAQKNMEYLTHVMKNCGFTTINNEWWHYDDSNWRKYPLLDIPL